MIKKQLAILISTALLAVTFVTPTVTNGQTSTDTQVVEKTRSEVQRLSTDRGKKAEVTLRDKTKIKGYITGVDQDSFTVSDPKTGATQTLSYAEVASVKKAGGGSIKPWLILGAVAAGVGITWAVVKPAVCDGGAQSRGIC